jgi:hypothetical protein
LNFFNSHYSVKIDHKMIFIAITLRKRFKSMMDFDFDGGTFAWMGEDHPPIPLRGEIIDQGEQVVFEAANVSLPAFPWRLHEMLDEAAGETNEHIISWLAGGDAFRVHDTKVFAQLIMPKYFKQTQYKSFQRQLNIYGFQRVTNGCNMGAYKHDLFVRGKANLCRFMTRTKVKSIRDAATASAPGLLQNGSCPDSLRDLQRALQKVQGNTHSLPPLRRTAGGDAGNVVLGHRQLRKKSISLGSVLEREQNLGGPNQPWGFASSTPTVSINVHHHDIAPVSQNFDNRSFELAMEPTPFAFSRKCIFRSSRIVTITAQNQVPDGSMFAHEDFDSDCLDDSEDYFLPLASEPLVDLTDDFFSSDVVSSTSFVSNDAFPPGDCVERK